MNINLLLKGRLIVCVSVNKDYQGVGGGTGLLVRVVVKLNLSTHNTSTCNKTFDSTRVP